MKRHTNDESSLREIISHGRAVIVVGSGVSMAATLDPATNRSHPQSSWPGLLEHGLNWLAEHKLMSGLEIQGHLALLRGEQHSHRLISAAQDIVAGMGGVNSKHFADWLKLTIGSIKATNEELLIALNDIRLHGHLLATTNYDGLLLNTGGDLTPVTWTDNDGLISVVRNWDITKVIFLHGFWRQPESVVLDWGSYNRISRNEVYRADQSAIWKTNVWVYVGCGINGLSDPDFGLLLERLGQHARQANHWDYFLVREHQREEVQSHFDTQKLNIHAISFGSSHADLPNYLTSLLPKIVSRDIGTMSGSNGSRHRRNKYAIPSPPAFYAEPNYIGSHQFVGRYAQLLELSNWANEADPTNLLLYEAIGGNGKSLLTWHWVTKVAAGVRLDWAGRFWYSFYEDGATMADFCRCALGYMTQRPIEDFSKLKTPLLAKELLLFLHAQPWLLVLDGLERILVAYHRLDASELPDEVAGTGCDFIANRNLCDTVRDEDSELLRSLCAANPSKLLVTSRLTPRVLLNPSGGSINGFKHVTLPGLTPSDAELLIRSCGVTGASTAIQTYLTVNCGNHPLVIGIIAGLITNYLPDRGNFDAWALAPTGGARLDLGKLDLTQRRNHILRTAIGALSLPSRHLLATLALLGVSFDYEIIRSLAPIPQDDPELSNIVKELELRGLLQYESSHRRYDLHPVVRSVTLALLPAGEKKAFGQKVIDFFSSQPAPRWETAQSLDDINNGLNALRTLIKLERFHEAVRAYRGQLATTLLFNIEAQTEVLSLLRPFFPGGWGELPTIVDADDASYLANSAANALRFCGEEAAALAAYGVALRCDIDRNNWKSVNGRLRNIAHTLTAQTRIALARRVRNLDLMLAERRGDPQALFLSQLSLFADYGRIGNNTKAAEAWAALSSLGRDWPRAVYRQGNAEYLFATWQYWQGKLEEHQLDAAFALAEKDSNRVTLRDLHRLSGMWKLEQGDWLAAATSFEEAVTMARCRTLSDEASETGLAVAKLHLGRLKDPIREAERLRCFRKPMYRLLASFWMNMGDALKAEEFALTSYRWAWSEGEPYVRRYELSKSAELLRELRVPVPILKPFNPESAETLSWEEDVRSRIERL